MSLRLGFAVGALVVTLSAPSAAFSQAAAAAQRTQTAVALNPDLLPLSGFGDWKATGSAAAANEPPRSLVNVDKAALEECNPERSSVENYAGAGGKTMHVEALELQNASGALAAYSLLGQPGMRELKGLGTVAALGESTVVFVTGAAVVMAFPATAADLSALQVLAAAMPKPTGSRVLQPLLPALLPTRGLQLATVHYALGERTYRAQGGVLPAAGLGWDKDAEGLTAKYVDRRGAETLTLLLYPTPTIAGPHLRNIEAQLAGLGPAFKNAKLRREGSLVILANGSFTPDAAQALVENTHLHQIASTDKAMPTPEVVETRKSFGMLANIIIFSGVLGLAALLLGVFLGGGRALVRVLRGKPAASEAEFLSLHLDPQNPAPIFSKE